MLQVYVYILKMQTICFPRTKDELSWAYRYSMTILEEA